MSRLSSIETDRACTTFVIQTQYKPPCAMCDTTTLKTDFADMAAKLVCVRCSIQKELPAFGKLRRNRLADICRDCKWENYWKSERLSTELRRALHGTLSPNKTEALIGCSTTTLRAHLQSQFLPAMTWENYGRSGWHMDHIAPCSAFNLADAAQVKLCYHYTNLRPSWAADNHKKSGKITPEAMQLLQNAGLVSQSMTA